MDYQQAKGMYETTRKRKLGNNTYLLKNDDGSYAIVLHNNQIIRFYPDKTVLSSCKWRTVTTKARLNQFTKFSVWQQNGIWYVGLYCEPGCQKNAVTAAVVFADGITYQNGKWLNAGNDINGTNKLRKAIRQYAKNFVTALAAGNVPKPDGGDCWFCCMVTDDGKTLGEHSKSNHIKWHIKEKYYVPSLCVNACKTFGVSKAAYWWLSDVWEKTNQCGCFADVAKRQIESAIRRYCYRQTNSAN